MDAIGLRFEDRLEGASNYSPWKERIALVLMENGIWEFVDYILTPFIDSTPLATHNQKDVKARRIILDAIKDHVIPHLSRKKTTREMWEALTKLYQNDNQNRKMVLREKLRDIEMSKSDTVASYLFDL